jgi:SAM-dependent methyltransferase
VSANLHEFDEVYRLEHASHFTRERTEREVDALTQALGLKPAKQILDLACGWGRHLAALRRRGFTQLVGVDVQGAFLEPLEGVVLLERDTTELEFSAEFDAVYCAFNALFSDADTAPQVFKAVAGALKPGGRFLLDTSNRERLARAATPARSWRGGGELPWLLEESHFELRTGAQHITQHRIFTDGHPEERVLTRFHYTLTELIKLCNAAGLTVREVYGDWQLNPYASESPRTMLVAGKEI